MVEQLASGPRTAGALALDAGEAFGISQPASSRHLRVLREAGLVESTVDGQRRLYALRPEPFDEVDWWLAGVQQFWTGRLDALDTEVRRGARRPDEDP